MPAIKTFLDRYFGKEQPKPPPISTTTAAALLILYTLLYVVPFYLSSTTRPSRTLSRDAPSVIRARVASVSLTCVVCSLITYAILTSSSGGHANATPREALHSLGYWPLGIGEAAHAVLLTAILFAGPLYAALIVEGGWRRCLSLESVMEVFTEWTRWRNIVAGPLTEESLFRSASIPLMLLAHTSTTKTIFLSPVIFGLAHVHHFYEARLTRPHEPVAAALVRSIVQLLYTSLFGAYATFVFLRSASLLAVFAVHAFCNVMGFPRFWGRVEPYMAEFEFDGDGDDRRKMAARNGRSGSNRGRPTILWSLVYYVLLVVGAIGWWKNLGTLTASENALVSMKM
ncbi:CaaX protease [Nemania sp. FL0916]|nr:CaaX protease [Nemania sp. FL0916]